MKVSRASRIALVMLPNFNALATLAFVDPFRAANYLRGPSEPLTASHQYTWQFLTLGETGANSELEASNGLTIAATPFHDVAKEIFDFVFICASWAPEQYKDRALFAWLRRQLGQGAAIGGVDTGAFLLGFAGLLDGYAATVHYEHLVAFEELFPKVQISDALYVIDRNRLTTCGGIAASDLALAIIRLQHGPDLANAASRYIFHDRLRMASETQVPSLHEPLGRRIPKALRDVISLMEETVEQPQAIADIAKQAGLSQRQLQRHFHTYTGVSPTRYYMDVRINRARGMVTQTDMSVLAISVACGFSSPEYMTKCYRERFEITPREDRIAGRVPFQFRSFPNYAFTKDRTQQK